jgi:hypothetical protein
MSHAFNAWSIARELVVDTGDMTECG